MNPYLVAIMLVVIGFLCGGMAGILIGYKLHQTDYTDEDPESFDG